MTTEVVAQEKHCSGPCGRTLPATLKNFWPHKLGRYGLQSRCKECQNRLRRERYHSDPEYRELRLIQNKTFRQDSPTYPERNRARVKTWRGTPEGQAHLRAYRRVYRQRPEVHEQILANQRARSQHPEVRERRLAYGKRYREMKRDTLPKLSFDDCRCTACIAPKPTRGRELNEHITAFLLAHPDMSFSEIGRRVGCSYEWVRQRKLRMQKDGIARAQTTIRGVNDD